MKEFLTILMIIFEICFYIKDIDSLNEIENQKQLNKKLISRVATIQLVFEIWLLGQIIEMVFRLN